MTVESLNRLLKRQIKKYQIPETFLEEHKAFFKAVNDAYVSSEQDLTNLENVLELNSKELYLANQTLENEKDGLFTEVLKSKKQLDKVMANVSDIIYEMDSNGNFTYLNPAWRDYAEVDAEDSLGRNFMEFSDGIKHFDSEILQKITNADFHRLETSFSRYDKNGRLRWWDMAVKIVKSPEGEIEGAIGSLVDVTDMKDKEIELKNANKAKSKFLSTMSHEIRTPLNAVIAISNILLMNEPKDHQLKNLNALKFSSKHLLNLINDILDYNKLSSGKLVLDNSPFNIRKIINGTLNSFAFSVNDKDIRLEKEISDLVPDGISGDSLRLSQILTNLIGNAVKFTEEGRVTLKVETVDETSEKIKLRFTVTDTGIGIPQDKLKHIFDRFMQAENSTSKLYGGTGLGLSICKKLLNIQGSNIKVESKVGKGTTFWFDLQFDKVERNDLTAIDPEQESKFDLKGMKLLVVDDNAMNLMVIEQFFEKWNVDYHSANNGQEAVDKIKEATYDAILMDLQMPVMNGYEAVAEIRSIGGEYLKLPIIALSASVSNEIIKKVGESGMDDYLSKPFDPIDLYRKLHRLSPVRQKV